MTLNPLNHMMLILNERDFEDDSSPYDDEDDFGIDRDFIDYKDLEDEEGDESTEEPEWDEMDDESRENDLEDFERLDDDGDQEDGRWLDLD